MPAYSSFKNSIGSRACIPLISGAISFINIKGMAKYACRVEYIGIDEGMPISIAPFN